MSEIDTSLITVGAPTDGGCAYISFAADPKLPTDATTAMSTLTDFVSLGDVSENGFTETRDISTTSHKDWGGEVVATTIDSDESTFKIELLEVNRASAAKLRYGEDSVTADGDSITQIEYNAYKGKGYPIVIDELETNGCLRRTVIKKGIVTSFDDVAHQKGSLMVYGLTITANKPADASAPVTVYRAKPAGSKASTKSGS